MGIFKKTSLFFLRAGISIVLLFFLFKQVDILAVWQPVRQANAVFLFLAFFSIFSVYLLAFLRWRMLIKACALPVSGGRLCVSFCAGVFFNSLLPSSVGGDLARSIDLSFYAKKTHQVVASVFLDRLSGYAGLLAVLLPAAFIGRGFLPANTVFFPLLLLCLIFAAVIFILFNRTASYFTQRALRGLKLKSASRGLKNLYRELHLLLAKKKIMLAGFLLSLAMQAAGPLAFYFIALSLGLRLSPLYFFIYMPIIGAITLLPVSIGGLGLREASIVFFFIPLGVDQATALAMSLVFFFFSSLYAAIAGVVYAVNLYYRRI